MSEYFKSTVPYKIAYFGAAAGVPGLTLWLATGKPLAALAGVVYGFCLAGIANGITDEITDRPIADRISDFFSELKQRRK